MKILLLTDERGSPKSAGGGFGYLLSILRPAASLGHEVEFMTADDIKDSFFTSKNREKKLDRLNEKIRTFEPDVINVLNNCLWGFEPFTIADKFNIPIILSPPDYMLFCKNRMFYKKDKDLVCDSDFSNCEYCDNNRLAVPEKLDIKGVMKDRKIIAISKFLKNSLVKAGFSSDNISVVELGLNPDDFVPSYGGSSGEILNISRISPEKGIDLYDKLAGMKPELKWILAGYPEIITRTTCFDYVGEIFDKDKKFLLKKCEIFASTPKWHEPVGYTYLEAKASGKPVVTFRLGGIPEYHEKCGSILIDYCNLKEMLDIIVELHKNEDYRIALGKDGRRQIEERNNENILIHKTIEIYDKVRGVR